MTASPTVCGQMLDPESQPVVFTLTALLQAALHTALPQEECVLLSELTLLLHCYCNCYTVLVLCITASRSDHTVPTWSPPAEKATAQTGAAASSVCTDRLLRMSHSCTERTVDEKPMGHQCVLTSRRVWSSGVFLTCTLTSMTLHTTHSHVYAATAQLLLALYCRSRSCC